MITLVKRKVFAPLLLVTAALVPVSGICADTGSSSSLFGAADRYSAIQKLIAGNDHRAGVAAGSATRSFMRQESVAEVQPKSAATPFNGLARLASAVSQQGAQTGLTAIAKKSPKNTDSKLWALHKNLPQSSLIKITNEANGQSIIVEVQGQLPANTQNVVELSPEAFAAAGLQTSSKVRVEQVIMP
jgi:hypothetical protein